MKYIAPVDASRDQVIQTALDLYSRFPCHLARILLRPHKVINMTGLTPIHLTPIRFTPIRFQKELFSAPTALCQLPALARSVRLMRPKWLKTKETYPKF